MLAAIVVALLAVPAESRHLVPQPLFEAIAAEYSGEAAQESTRQIVQYHRIQGSPMMAAVATDVVLAKLKALGIEASIEQFPSDGSTRYATWISPMGWDMRGGELWVDAVAGDASFVPYRICRYSDVPMCVSTYSKGGTWSGELIDVGDGTKDEDYKGKSVAGKIVLATGYAADVVRKAVLKHGAAGTVIYPDPLDRPDHPDMVRYNGLWTRAGEVEKTRGSFQISANQMAKLRALMRRGAVTVRGTIDATLAPGKLTIVHAYVRGTEKPEREVLVTAHLDHPKWSANDNASGSGAMLEVARTVKSMVDAKKVTLRKTLHFMWVPEFFGTMAYVTEHGAANVVANVNMDMIGEDTVKTNSRFYYTRTPDSVPGPLNALLADVLEQTKEAALVAPSGSRNTWPTEAYSYSQGSDHDIFLGLGIPSTMLGHDPDWTHHTSEDTIDKTDATELRRVGVFATAAAVSLASADEEATQRLNALAAAEQRADLALRIGRATAFGTPAGCLARYRAASAGTAPLVPAGSASGRGPRRLVLLPFDGTAYEPLAGTDLAWWTAQDDALGGPHGPGRDLVAYEAVNLMDGRRTTAEIAEALSCEFERAIDAAWADRLVTLLETLRLVARR